VVDFLIVPSAIAKWSFADIVTGAISTAADSAPVRHARNHCADPVLYINAAVVAGRPMPSDNNAFDNASEKK